MKRLILFLFLPVLCFGQASNPPRYRNQPQQFPYGPWSQVYPFDGANGFTTVRNDALQPSALITKTESFGSVGDFTSVGTGQTFTVASNVGTISASGASSVVYLNTGTSWPAADAFVPLALNQIGAAATSDVGGVGICKNDASASVRILAEYDQVNGKAQIDVFSASTDNILGAVSFTPTAGNSIALGLAGTDAVVWQGSASAGWTMLTHASISSVYNPQTDGNLTGFESCFYVTTGAATTTSWQVSNLVSGAIGGVVFGPSGIFHQVIYPDGRPYVNGTKFYFTATINDGASNGATSALLDYDTSTDHAEILAKYWVDWSGSTINFSVPQIIYDPISAKFRVTYAAWGIAASLDVVPFYYGSWTQSALDMLASGVHVVTGTSLAQMSVDHTHGWDETLWCSQFNPSTGACSNWDFARTAVVTAGVSYHPELDSSTSDPGVNSWTSQWTSSSGCGLQEGGQLYRTRATSGSLGFSYYPMFSQNCGNMAYGASYSATGSYQGTMGYIVPSNTSQSVGHVVAFEYGAKRYALTWDGNQFGSTGQYGELEVASAPVNIPAPQMAETTYVADSGGTSGGAITSGATAIGAGTYLTVCTGSASGLTTIPVTSSPAATWTSVNSWTNGTYLITEYEASLAAGSTTFTCTPNVSATNRGMVVMQLIGTTGIADSSATLNYDMPVSNPLGTISGISTSQSDLGILCRVTGSTVAFASSSWTSGQLPWIAFNNSSLDSTHTAAIICAAGTIPGPSTSLSASLNIVQTQSSILLFTGFEFANPAPTAQAPLISPQVPQFYNSASVTLSGSPSGATVCYTTDGSTPTIGPDAVCTHGSTYSGAINISSTTTINAVAGKLGYQGSAVSSYTYTSMSAPFQFVFGTTGSPGGSMTATLNVVAGVPYIASCFNLNVAPTISSVPAVSWTSHSYNDGGPSPLVFAWGVFSTSGAATITCNVSGGSDTFFEVLDCPSCNGSAGTIVSQSAGSGSTSITVSGLTATSNNWSLLLTFPRTTSVSGVTIDGTTATQVSEGSFSTPNHAYWADLPSYSSQSATATWAAATFGSAVAAAFYH